MTQRLIDLIVMGDFNNGPSRGVAVLEPRLHVRQFGPTHSIHVFSSANTAATITLYGECGGRIHRVERGQQYATDVASDALLGIAVMWLAGSIVRDVRGDPGIRSWTRKLEQGQVATSTEGARS